MTIAPGFETRYRGGSYRTDGLLDHSGKLIVRNVIELQPDIFGKSDLVLPPGTITTPDIAQYAVQDLVGRYASLLSYTLPSSSTWTETPIQANCTFLGQGASRVEFNFAVICPTKGQRVFWGVFADGSLATGSGQALGVADAPENSYAMMAYGQYYIYPTAPAGTHRIGVGLYGPSGTQIPNLIYSTLYVTEQKR